MDELKELLTGYRIKCAGDLEDTEWFCTKKPSRRNTLAREAAIDHRDRFDVLDSIVRQGLDNRLEEQLRTNRNHAEDWENNFRTWAGRPPAWRPKFHEHDYARQVHNWNKDRYNTLLERARNLPSVSVSGTTTRLQCLLSIGGEGSGYVRQDVTYETGMRTDKTYSAREYEKISVKVGADIRDFINHVQAVAEGTYGHDIQSGSTSTATTKSTESHRFVVKLEKPCYLYQVVTELTLGDQSHGAFRGTLIQRNEPFPDKVMAVKWASSG